MGYTHYWDVAGADFSKVWPQIVSDAQLIVSESGVALSRDGCDDAPATLSVKGGIMLNGVPGNEHEPFELDTKGGTRGFCKTARKKYDLVVTSILLRAFQLAGEAFDVRSDGTWEEWKPAQDLVAKLWPDDEIVSPLRYRYTSDDE